MIIATFRTLYICFKCTQLTVHKIFFKRIFSYLIYTKFYKRMYLLFWVHKESVHFTYCKEMFLVFTMGVQKFHFTISFICMSCPCVLIYLIIVFPMLFYICKNSCTYSILISLLLCSSFLLSFACAPVTSLCHTGGAPMAPLCLHWRCPCDPSLSTLRCLCDPVFVHTGGAPVTLSLSTLAVPL